MQLHFKAQIIGILIAHYKTKTMKISVFFHGKSIAFPTLFEVIYQTRGRVFPPISKHQEVGWKSEAQPSFFNQLRGVWK